MDNCVGCSGKRGALKRKTTGNLYLIRDKRTWYNIKEALRQIIINRVEDAYTFNAKKVMNVKPVDNVPQTLDFADAVVRLYQNETNGQKEFWDNYKKQEDEIKKQLPNYQGKKWSLPGKGGIGIAMWDKQVLVKGGKKYIVCISEGAVYVDSVKSLAGSKSNQKDSVDYSKPLSQLPDDAQKKVAYGIGNSLAHEARHQLEVYPEHADAGIGMDPNNTMHDYHSMLFGSDSTFSVSDQSCIKDQIQKLHKRQGRTVPIKR